MQAAARTLYVLALALLVVMTVGFGLVTFYPGPHAPEYPSPVAPAAVPADGTKPPAADAEQRAAQEQYDRDSAQYRTEERTHARNALAIVTAIGVLALLAGLVAAGAPDVLRVGVMLGGVFVVVWGLMANANHAGSGTMFAVALLAMLTLAAVSLPASRRLLQRAFRSSGTDLLGPS